MSLSVLQPLDDTFVSAATDETLEKNLFDRSGFALLLGNQSQDDDDDVYFDKVPHDIDDTTLSEVVQVIQLAEHGTAFQFTGAVGVGSRSICTKDPLAKPKAFVTRKTIIAPPTKPVKKKSFRLGKKSQSPQPQKIVTESVDWKPFVEPFQSFSGSTFDKERMISYFETHILAAPGQVQVFASTEEGDEEAQEAEHAECIAIGLTDTRFNPNKSMPGWKGSVCGYHGDDGTAFFGSNKIREYGPTFGVGDVVGFGADFVTKRIFYTLNGQFLGHGPSALTTSELKQDWFPTVGLDTHACVQLNFGKDKPFVFDLQSMIENGPPEVIKTRQTTDHEDDERSSTSTGDSSFAGNDEGDSTEDEVPATDDKVGTDLTDEKEVTTDPGVPEEETSTGSQDFAEKNTDTRLEGLTVEVLESALPTDTASTEIEAAATDQGEKENAEYSSYSVPVMTKEPEKVLEKIAIVDEINGESSSSGIKEPLVVSGEKAINVQRDDVEPAAADTLEKIVAIEAAPTAVLLKTQVENTDSSKDAIENKLAATIVDTNNAGEKLDNAQDKETFKAESTREETLYGEDGDEQEECDESNRVAAEEEERPLELVANAQNEDSGIFIATREDNVVSLREDVDFGEMQGVVAESSRVTGTLHPEMNKDEESIIDTDANEEIRNADVVGIADTGKEECNESDPLFVSSVAKVQVEKATAGLEGASQDETAIVDKKVVNQDVVSFATNAIESFTMKVLDNANERQVSPKDIPGIVFIKETTAAVVEETCKEETPENECNVDPSVIAKEAVSEDLVTENVDKVASTTIKKAGETGDVTPDKPQQDTMILLEKEIVPVHVVETNAIDSTTLTLAMAEKGSKPVLQVQACGVVLQIAMQEGGPADKLVTSARRALDRALLVSCLKKLSSALPNVPREYISSSTAKIWSAEKTQLGIVLIGIAAATVGGVVVSSRKRS